MAMPRKSIEEHELVGTKPNYDIGTRLSHIPAGRPKIPKFLSGVAKKKFKDLVQLLEKRRVCTAGDCEVICQHAVIFERWLDAQTHLRAEGSVITMSCLSKAGELYDKQVTNPYLKIATTCEKQMALSLVQLGLTVQARDKARPTMLTPANEIVPGSVADLYPEMFGKPTLAVVAPIDPRDMVADDEPVQPEEEAKNAETTND
ncbi:MAG: phage terminase small subunit P27 family [Candidatus Acidiferrales bacterium]